MMTDPHRAKAQNDGDQALIYKLGCELGPCDTVHRQMVIYVAMDGGRL